MTAAREPLNTAGRMVDYTGADSESLSELVPRVPMVTRREKLTRIFQIGFNKCGTRSLYRFLQRNGIYSAHFNRGRLAMRMRYNLDVGRKPLNGRLGQYVGFTDVQRISKQQVIEGAMLYRELYHYYPNSYFILNTRDKEGWLRSRQSHGAGNYMNRYMKALRLPDEAAIMAYWSEQWDIHHRDVPEFFKDKPGRLIVFDIKNDDPKRLVDFLAPDFETDAHNFLHEGETAAVDKATYKKNRPITLPGL
ncbi:MAG: sulfotransferase [Pseudomonadota bacterium]